MALFHSRHCTMPSCDACLGIYLILCFQTGFYLCLSLLFSHVLSNIISYSKIVESLFYSVLFLCLSLLFSDVFLNVIPYSKRVESLFYSVMYFYLEVHNLYNWLILILFLQFSWLLSRSRDKNNSFNFTHQVVFFC